MYNPAGIMQRARKRSADSRITLATVARDWTACRPEEEGRANVFLSTEGGLGHISGCPKVAYSVNPGT